MGINPYLAGALIGLVAYAGLYFLFDRGRLSRLYAMQSENKDLPDVQRQKLLGRIKLLIVLYRFVTPALLIGYFAYRGPDVFGGTQ